MLIASTGGEHGYLSRSNIQYILETVKDTGEKLPKRKAVIRKAAFLLYNVIIIHPFVNGNKRTGYELTRAFLQLNGYDLRSNANDTYEFILQIAQGRTSAKDVEAWIARNLTDWKERRST